ncbi:MAG: DUF302 domain-containing protein [Gammaproteobacteria bacterium]|nr:DUF302 domain-containing protein [Gammaproteobacteria bacterium]
MYGFGTTIKATTDEAVEKVTLALKDEGFGILTEINVQAVMKAKIDVDMKPYRILGACNPHLARQAIEAEPDIGLLLPCNVLVRDDGDGNTFVGFMDPNAVLTLVDRPEVIELATMVKEKLERVRDALNA